jgi:hypothetical protein
MHIHIGHCGTPGVVWLLDTFYYYYTATLLWYRQEKLEEMMREQWNNAARRHGQRACIKRHAPVMAGKRVRIWDGTVMGTLPPADCCPNMGRDGRLGGDTSQDPTIP